MSNRPMDQMTQTPEIPAQSDAIVEDVVDVPLLTAPADGVPPVIDTREALEACMTSLRAGTGPVAVDAERAQGFRYGASAWLIQLRRTGSGTFLVDPAAFDWKLTELGDAIADAEWIIHAASQDIPCLHECGMEPTTLFDTELAGRLLNLPRVGLGAMIERYFGLRLLKEHSAADWSQRPLPENWLVYAALDVELLVELRDKLAADLTAAGKDEWARQEFAALAAGASDDPTVRVEPWRRTSGVASLRTPLQLALVREIWETRDELARRLDKGPGRILQDAAIIAMAEQIDPKTGTWPTRESLRGIDALKRRNARRFEANWLAAIDAVKVLPRSKYPARHMKLDGPPAQPRNWESRHPEEYARWLVLRPLTQEIAGKLDLPPENLVSPAVLRQVAWAPPFPATADAVHAALLSHGARAWQVDHIAGPIADALATMPAPETTLEA